MPTENVFHAFRTNIYTFNPSNHFVLLCLFVFLRLWSHLIKMASNLPCIAEDHLEFQILSLASTYQVLELEGTRPSQDNFLEKISDKGEGLNNFIIWHIYPEDFPLQTNILPPLNVLD